MKKYQPIENFFKYKNFEKFSHSKVKVKTAEVKSLLHNLFSLIYVKLCIYSSNEILKLQEIQ